MPHAHAVVQDVILRRAEPGGDVDLDVEALEAGALEELLDGGGVETYGVGVGDANLDGGESCKVHGVDDPEVVEHSAGRGEGEEVLRIQDPATDGIDVRLSTDEVEA